MGEIVVAMLIFFMIVGFGLIFFTRYAESATRKAVSEVNFNNLAESAKIVSTLPEIQCSFAGDDEITCIDTYRAQAFSDEVNGTNRLHYSDLFHGFKADVTCIYPCDTINSTSLFDYTDSGENTVEFLIPIIIYNPLTEEHSYGGLFITQQT